jgi:hypothetical protein
LSSVKWKKEPNSDFYVPEGGKNNRVMAIIIRKTEEGDRIMILIFRKAEQRIRVVILIFRKAEGKNPIIKIIISLISANKENGIGIKKT